MIEEGARTFGDGNWLVNARAVRVASLEDIRTIVLQQDIFSIVDVACRLPVRHFFNPAPQTVIPIAARRDGRGIPGRKLLHLNQPIFWIKRVLRVIPRREQRLLDQIPVVIVLIRRTVALFIFKRCKKTSDLGISKIPRKQFSSMI